MLPGLVVNLHVSFWWICVEQRKSSHTDPRFRQWLIAIHVSISSMVASWSTSRLVFVCPRTFIDFIQRHGKIVVQNIGFRPWGNLIHIHVISFNTPEILSSFKICDWISDFFFYSEVCSWGFCLKSPPAWYTAVEFGSPNRQLFSLYWCLVCVCVCLSFGLFWCPSFLVNLSFFPFLFVFFGESSIFIVWFFFIGNCFFFFKFVFWEVFDILQWWVAGFLPLLAGLLSCSLSFFLVCLLALVLACLHVCFIPCFISVCLAWFLAQVPALFLCCFPVCLFASFRAWRIRRLVRECAPGARVLGALFSCLLACFLLFGLGGSAVRCGVLQHHEVQRCLEHGLPA